MEQTTASQPDTEEYVIIPVAEFRKHMAQTAVCVGMLNGVMSALAQNPMFAGFLPADLREQIAQLAD